MPEPRYQVREIEISAMQPGANVRSQVQEEEIVGTCLPN